jgi:hypothetical protein
MSFIDLDLEILKCHTPLSFEKEMAYEFRKNHFFSTDGLSAQIRISAMCRAIQGQLQNQKFFLLEPVLLYGLCATNLSQSLRDIETCLRVAQNKTYHMGIRGQVSRNTLAHANQVRDWRIYADFAQGLIAQARSLYAHVPGVR